MVKFDPSAVALVGGGPAALFMMKNIIRSEYRPAIIYIFEKNERLGAGMPYGKHGSSHEHVANVSANELPELEDTFEDYILKHPTNEFPDFFTNGSINPYQVIPRLLLGNYLENQFEKYISIAKHSGIEVIIRKNTAVEDIKQIEEKKFNIIDHKGHTYKSDAVVICTGHFWPKKHEEKVKGWYDSPYPPSKFDFPTNFPVAIRGTSLTAVDAIKTISRRNGTYMMKKDKSLRYILNEDSQNFSIDLFSLGGFLPALRFHSEDDAYSPEWSMSFDEIYEYKKNHGGFVDLDHVFEINFKLPLQKKDPEFHDQIKTLSIEDFVDKMMEIRKELDSFELFKAEFAEAEKSIRRKQSISWKETLSAFSYAMNYPAKHFSAEDMLRLRKTLMPLISIIIASLPQSSYQEIIALYDAGIINLIQVNKESRVEPHPDSGGIYYYRSNDETEVETHYQLYVDAIGQQPMEINNVPFEGLKSGELISSGYLLFRDEAYGEKLYTSKDEQVMKGYNNNYYLKVHGLSINDHFQAQNSYGQITENLYIMAVPYIGGLNPDYSGLDFCDTASERIAESLRVKNLS